MLGVVDDLLVDRAFIAQRRDSAIELAKLADVAPYAPHNVENALAAAALARVFGVPPHGRRARACSGSGSATIASRPSPRSAASATSTTPRRPTRTPPRRRCGAFEHVVWIAGGQAKGTTFDDLVAAVAPDSLRGAVVLGRRPRRDRGRARPTRARGTR